MPKAEASSIVQDTQKPSNNSEIAEISLAMAGLEYCWAVIE